MSRASDAYERLTAAMATWQPGCVGVDLFTGDDTSKANHASMSLICDACPLFALCSEYAALSKPHAGFWAGKPHRTYKGGDAE